MTQPCFDPIEQIKSRIKNIFLVNNWWLKNTDAETLLSNFYVNGSTIEDLNTLRISLNAYKDNLDMLNNGYLELYRAVNNVLVPTESEYLSKILGCGKLTSKTRQESFDGGRTYITTVKSLIGPSSINALSASDDDTITGVIGNHELLPITILGITSPAPKSISDGINIYGNAVSNAVGKVALNIVGSLILNKCTLGSNISGEQIYAVPSAPSVIDAWNGVVACSLWVVNSESYGITNTSSADDCRVFEAEKALAGCISSFAD